MPISQLGSMDGVLHRPNEGLLAQQTLDQEFAKQVDPRRYEYRMKVSALVPEEMSCDPTDPTTNPDKPFYRQGEGERDNGDESPYDPLDTNTVPLDDIDQDRTGTTVTPPAPSSDDL